MKKITKEEAFTPVEGEKNIPVDLSVHKFQFTRNWFKSRNQKTWSTFFPPQFSSKKPVRMIQIGVFEGMDLVWCLQNILQHEQSRVLAVDPWLPTTKIDEAGMEGVYRRALNNLRPYKDKVRIERGKSQELLGPDCGNVTVNGAVIQPGQWDLIVIDGDHRAPFVYMDAENCLRLVKPGGWLVFDDVRNRIFKKEHVLHGLEEFLLDFGDQVELVWQHRYCDCYRKKTPE